MAVKFRVPKNFGKKTKKAIEESLDSDEFLNKSGKLIQKNMRLSINDGEDPKTGKQYKGLSRRWVSTKERIKPYNKTARGYQKGKSNLTFTGQFVLGIKYSIERLRGSKVIEVFSRGSRKGYKYSKTGKRVKSPDNKKLGEYLAEQGRNPYGITKAASKAVIKLAKREIRKALKAFNK